MKFQRIVTLVVGVAVGVVVCLATLQLGDDGVTSARAEDEPKATAPSPVKATADRDA